MTSPTDNEIIEAVERALVHIGVKPTVARMRQLLAHLDDMLKEQWRPL